MQQDAFTRLTAFLQSLERGKIHYTLQNCRDEAIMVLVTVPGERWEVEFLADGSVEIERFVGDGEIYGADTLGELFAKYTDQACEGGAENVALLKEGVVSNLTASSGPNLLDDAKTWQEMRAARMRALRGKYRHMLTPSDEFARQKQEEIALERDR
jgi:hypothetical protein